MNSYELRNQEKIKFMRYDRHPDLQGQYTTVLCVDSYSGNKKYHGGATTLLRKYLNKHVTVEEYDKTKNIGTSFLTHAKGRKDIDFATHHYHVYGTKFESDPYYNVVADEIMNVCSSGNIYGRGYCWPAAGHKALATTDAIWDRETKGPKYGGVGAVNDKNDVCSFANFYIPLYGEDADWFKYTGTSGESVVDTLVKWDTYHKILYNKKKSTNSEKYEMLINFCVDMGIEGYDHESGWGLPVLPYRLYYDPKYPWAGLYRSYIEEIMWQRNRATKLHKIPFGRITTRWDFMLGFAQALGFKGNAIDGALIYLRDHHGVIIEGRLNAGITDLALNKSVTRGEAIWMYSMYFNHLHNDCFIPKDLSWPAKVILATEHVRKYIQFYDDKRPCDPIIYGSKLAMDARVIGYEEWSDKEFV